jgi:hypothetical protein
VLLFTHWLFYPQGKRTGSHCTGGWVDSRAGLDENTGSSRSIFFSVSEGIIATFFTVEEMLLCYSEEGLKLLPLDGGKFPPDKNALNSSRQYPL